MQDHLTSGVGYETLLKMECNKEEAVRAKEICEAKIAEKDFIGAKKFAQKADKLFHGLEGISQLLVILDVYISSEKKVNGEGDWYGVLGVGPTADDEAIRKNYKKLALFLHPDKNKSVGAEGAFKLVSQAWTLLSNDVRKKVYDQTRNPRPVYQSVTLNHKTSAFTTHTFQTIPRPLNVNTFWTSCQRCSIRYEYERVYLNQNLICRECREPFLAIESPAPPMEKQYPMETINHHVNSQQGPSLNPSAANHVNVQKGPTLKKTSGVNRFRNRLEAKTDAVRHQCSAKSDGSLKRKRVAEQFSSVHVNLGSQKVKVDNSRRELSQAEIRVMLATKARKEIVKKMEEWNVEKAPKKENSVKKPGEEAIVSDSTKVQDVKAPLTGVTDTDEMDADVADVKATLMSVPDPDFHDFDMDRTERSFAENQVWAAYDDEDGMPRYYAMIHNVISRKPFKMEISWLNAKSNAELGPILWVSSGFPKTSGEFRIGKHEFNTSLNSFSHKVQYAKAKKGVIQIYPKKGDVWALYKNWSPNWDQFTPDEVIHEYDMVAVLEDFSEEKGVTVAPLVKISGFKSVFHQHADVAKVRTIPRNEIFRLSHQVPFSLLTGEDSVNVPEGCLELDPAALPLELLQTTIEPKVKEVEVKKVITYSRKKVKLQGPIK